MNKGMPFVNSVSVDFIIIIYSGQLAHKVNRNMFVIWPN